jgi:hypothetical protein
MSIPRLHPAFNSCFEIASQKCSAQHSQSSHILCMIFTSDRFTFNQFHFYRFCSIDILAHQMMKLPSIKSLIWCDDDGARISATGSHEQQKKKWFLLEKITNRAVKSNTFLCPYPHWDFLLFFVWKKQRDAGQSVANKICILKLISTSPREQSL